jgi:hypothetical protein
MKISSAASGGGLIALDEPDFESTLTVVGKQPLTVISRPEPHFVIDEEMFWHNILAGGPVSPPPPLEHPTPCEANAGEPMPSANMEDIRRAVNDFGPLIANSTIEFVALVYVLDGQIHVSATATSHNGFGAAAQFSEFQIPNDATIVGLVHNHHPSNSPNADIRLPSTEITATEGRPGDWKGAYASLFQTPYPGLNQQTGISFDPHGIMYIVTPDGIYEYTQSDFETDDAKDGGKLSENGSCG